MPAVRGALRGGRRPADANDRQAPPPFNPACAKPATFLSPHHGGAEIEGTFLFADIRGSTASPKDAGDDSALLLDRFYSIARGRFDHDGMVDKFVGDELVAMFVPLLAGERHASLPSRLPGTARRTGHPAAPWVPIGAGVHTGRAWVGAVGEGAHAESPRLATP